MAERSEAITRLLFGSRRGIAGTVYGTIVVMATVAAGSVGNITAWRLAIIVPVTAVVLWAAHAYAHGLAESIANQRRLRRGELVGVARREAAIALAGVAPTAALLLGAVGIFGESTAIWVAFGIGFVTLGVQGVRYASVESLDRRGAIVAVALNLAIGSVIVAMKVLLAH